MSKFKKGDAVRIIGRVMFQSCVGVVTNEGTVMCMVTFPSGTRLWYADSDLEVVK